MALTDNLISHWSLEESSGAALDDHGSNDLDDNATVETTTGKVGNARNFASASAEHFSHSDNADLSTGDIDFTVALWLNLASKPASSFLTAIGKYDISADHEYGLTYDTSADRLIWGVSANGSADVNVTASTAGALSTGTWYFVVAWHDSANNQIGIQVNNGTADTASHSGGVFDGTAFFIIGALQGGNNWDGPIDQVGFWKRLLTSEEKTWLHNSGAGRSYAEIVAGMAADPSRDDGAILIAPIGYS